MAFSFLIDVFNADNLSDSDNSGNSSVAYFVPLFTSVLLLWIGMGLLIATYRDHVQIQERKKLRNYVRTNYSNISKIIALPYRYRKAL